MMDYRYVECGLDNVIISGAAFMQDDAGERVISIPNINGLHRVIALGIVSQPSGMTGKELRFLRTEMGMTQAELAQMMHREPLAISRWERGEVPIDSNAETLIRLHAAEALNLEINATIKEISGWSVPTAQPRLIEIDGTNPSDYKLAA